MSKEDNRAQICIRTPWKVKGRLKKTKMLPSLLPISVLLILYRNLYTSSFTVMSHPLAQSL